jgi:Mg-chelatase subunit ChlD
MEIFRTSVEGYLAPSREEMRDAAEKVGLRSYSRDLAIDLANLAAGGKVNPPSKYSDAVMQRVIERLEKPDSDGEWKLSNGRWTKEKSEIVADRHKKQMAYHQNVCDFLSEIDMNRFEGETPLEQAMSCLKLLSKLKGGNGGGEDGEPLPIFQEGSPEGVAHQLHDSIDSVDTLSETEKELMGETPEMSKREIAEDMMGDKSIWLNISRQLDSLSKMQVRKCKKQEADPNGEEVITRSINGFDELSKLSKSEWASYQTSRSYFWYRVAGKQARVRERVITIEKKQLLFIMVDCSGSMDSGNRIAKACGILMNRLKAVIAGEAELYFSFFDTELVKVYSVKTPEEAKSLMETLRNKNFSGCLTNIDGCMKQAKAEIDKIIAEGATYRPELVVVTDGDDTISSTAKDFAGTKVHAFVVEKRNPKLVNLAKATGGVGIENF